MSSPVVPKTTRITAAAPRQCRARSARPRHMPARARRRRRAERATSAISTRNCPRAATAPAPPTPRGERGNERGPAERDERERGTHREKRRDEREEPRLRPSVPVEEHNRRGGRRAGRTAECRTGLVGRRTRARCGCARAPRSSGSSACRRSRAADRRTRYGTRRTPPQKLAGARKHVVPFGNRSNSRPVTRRARIAEIVAPGQLGEDVPERPYGLPSVSTWMCAFQTFSPSRTRASHEREASGGAHAAVEQQHPSPCAASTPARRASNRPRFAW